ncbi:hypothetical protein pdam_00007053 [Pocillopora damicornis]|uniref:DUF4371 domain-containing protein n=1 Tax=Pocillopora damicornis TaxID=46731 RepID=A0A3M6T8Z4_POCDA|nr:hypothetical protein pdam_00007053 [Pocillopora damicornis]
MSSAAKRASERPREERPLRAALSRLDEETLKKMEWSNRCSCLEEEIVYVRFVSGGAPKTCYVELAEVESAKAPGILKAIKSDMDKIHPQWMQKIISTGTDGASVMMGRIGGVVSLIKQDAPQVIGIHSGPKA